ncbi:RodZ domain-containing protein [Actinomadura sp. 9N215]|uniref:RodZ domain-containing protein n=1 Tax=Actinomadura sp. 9N215 TaxID=3375150 RepID=UPI00379F21F5
MALVNAVTSEPEPKGPSTNATSPPADDSGGGEPSPEAATSPATVLPLVIRVTGPATNVVVRVAETGGEVLAQGTLNQGETRNFRKTPLQVVAANGGALQVVIYGKVQPPKPDGKRGQWFVEARSS